MYAGEELVVDYAAPRARKFRTQRFLYHFGGDASKCDDPLPIAYTPMYVVWAWPGPGGLGTFVVLLAAATAAKC